MEKISKKVCGIVVSIFIVGFFFLTLIREKGVISYHENRKLAEFPKLSTIADGTFFSGLSDYVSDHFAFRRRLLEINAKSNIYTGEPIVNDVYISKDMMLSAKKRHSVKNSENAKKINSFAESYQGSVYVMAVPSSDGVYTEKLPEYLTSCTQKSQIDSFYASLGSNIKKIDAYNILKMLSDNYIYYRNDTKWTSYGAFCVYKTAIQKLGFQPVTYDKYKIEHMGTDFRGNLYNKTLSSNTKADMIDVYVCIDGKNVTDVISYDKNGKAEKAELYDKSFLETNEPYKFYLGENDILKIKTDIGNDKKILVFKDEFADCFIPFLTQHYSEIAVVSEKCGFSDYKNIIKLSEYNQVLFLYGADNIIK